MSAFLENGNNSLLTI